MKIVVIGTGYVGLAQGVCLAHLGHDVICVDLDVAKVDALNRGEVPIFERDLPELLHENLLAGRITFTNDLAEAVADNPAVVFVCVQTPQHDDGSCDLSYIERVLRDVGAKIKADTIVVVKSTVPPGTRTVMHEWLNNPEIELAANPEFLRQGTSIQDFLHPDRIVIGVESERAAQVLESLYVGIEAPIFIVSVETAQLTKYAANSMLASRLSFINEIAKIADLVGADIKSVEKLVGLDHRIGEKFLRSSAGFGGGCLPKDTLALCHLGQTVGSEPIFLQSIIEVNDNQPRWFVRKIEKILGNLDGQQVGVWGLSFNQGTDDVRYSPAIRIIEELLERGAKVVVYDPQAMEKAKQVLGQDVMYAASAIEAARGAVALFTLTEWPQFLEVDWLEVKQVLSRPIIFDAKHFLPHQELWEAGFEVHGIGLWRPEDSRQL
ncbi:MAG: UDP-glucose/GDP-mannose dehydrogenase family protein [Patescibacteria group bacterium]|nr:UDP-glucose/GDP-mannose dehydrogenase family protein [Patescibacteria group bacterium]